MPLIDLSYTAGALEPKARAEAIERLTAALLRHEGAADNEATRAMSRAFVHELPPAATNVGGSPAEHPIYRLVLTVPEGTLLHGPGPFAAQARRNLVQEATEILLEAEGSELLPGGAGRVYCLIEEVPDGYWGGLGTTFRMEDIVAFANPDMPQTPAAEQARGALEASALSVTPAVLAE
jgi:phenylpyruvate tautomerase PptA (4-oxalocrotonate tautomerase family)